MATVFIPILFTLREKSLSGHSITLNQTVAATSADIKGATGFEISGKIYALIFFFQIAFVTSVF